MNRIQTRRARREVVQYNYTVRLIASMILRDMYVGKSPNFDTDVPATLIRAAYTLLKFEGYVRKKEDYELTSEGYEHVNKHGPKVYRRPVEKS